MRRVAVSPMQPDTISNLLDEAREAFARHDWVTAYSRFLAARDAALLSADDCFALADSAWWLGRVDESLVAFETAYRGFVSEGRVRPASLAALSIGYTLAIRGDLAIASGWIGRAGRLLGDESDCAERGYLLYVDIEMAFEENDIDSAIAKTRELHEMSRRFADPNLAALSVLAEGLALVRQGHVPTGMDLLDEAMVAALSDDLDPSWAGNIYCKLMHACHELGDIRRAVEWTNATSRWCEGLTATGPFLGICRVYRAQIFQIQGDWERAEGEATLVSTDETRFEIGSIAEAFYRIGELRRLRGDLNGAASAYREAHALGRDPQPGRALALLAEGRADAAAATIEAALVAGKDNPLGRFPLRAAQVEIALAAGNLTVAAEAAGEVDTTADTYGCDGLIATARQVRGGLLLAQGDAGAALQALRGACHAWQALCDPYETARVRVFLARAYTALGDEDTAERELEAARSAFLRLGAMPDVRALPARRQGEALPGGLTKRELQVITLVATGKTNQEIGDELFISARTVARHLENIYAKLSISSRASAAVWAIAHQRSTRPHE